MFRKACAALLIPFILFIINFNSFAASAARSTIVPVSVSSDKEQITPLKKGVNTGLSYIVMDTGTGLSVSTGAAISAIKILGGLSDETYKFDVSFSSGKLRFDLKYPLAGSPYRLKEHTVYDISVPEGTFSAADSSLNSKLDYLFVTGSSDSFSNDIITDVTPSSGVKNADSQNGTIKLSFIDDITTDAAVNIKDYVVISSSASTIPALSSGSDTTSDFNISISGSAILIASKSGKLRDFNDYTVKLLKNAVYLKNYPANKIYNDDFTFSFSTNNMIKSTSPLNNQSGVGLEPTISVSFKYPVVLGDRSLINISSNAGAFSLDQNRDISLSSDGLTLNISINDYDSQGNGRPLRKSTLYKVTTSPGAVTLMGCTGLDASPVNNENMELYFVTTGNGDSPSVTGLTSEAGTDDITSPASSQLTSKGVIYVHFDRPIAADKQILSLPLKDAVKLYKVPKADTKSYDSNGNQYDSLRSFYPVTSGGTTSIIPGTVPSAQGVDGIEDKANLDEIAVGSVEISGSVLKVTPGVPLSNLEKYRITIDNRDIEDTNGYNVQYPLEFSFWTKASEDKSPSWSGIQDTMAQDVSVAGSTYKNYTLSGAPVYEPYSASVSVPHIVISVDGEIIPSINDQTVKTVPSKVTRESFDALNKITLSESFTGTSLGFSRYELEYIRSASGTSTKLHLYPSVQLDSGKAYTLFIPQDTFESRSGSFLKALELDFTTEGNSTKAKGISGLSNNSIGIADLKGNGESSFEILGYNFTEDFDKVTLTPVSGNALLQNPVDIAPSNIVFQSVTRLKVKISGDLAATLGNEKYTGEYSVTLHFTDSATTTCVSPVNLRLVSKGRPVATQKYPYSDSAWYDESSLNPKVIDGKTVYFLKVTFKDTDGSLTFNNPDGLTVLRDSSIVNVLGSSASLIDSDFLTLILQKNDSDRKYYIDTYLFTKDTANKQAFLYVPVKLLRPQTSYSVTIMTDVVCYSDLSVSLSGNDVITWNFTTMASPLVRSISLGTISEGYADGTTINITGDLFYSSSVSVFFGSTQADSVTLKTASDNSKYLEVTLPYDNGKLKPGVYDIIVQNDSNHQRIVYGALSVIKAGDEVPGGDSQIKVKDSSWTVTSDVKVSQDTIKLEQGLIGIPDLKLDLDSLMGTNSLVRKITFDGNSSYTIGELETKSIWGNIDIYGLTLDSSTGDNKITVYVGRPEPKISESLKSKLGKNILKSDFLQVTGSNFKIDKAVISIPVKGNDMENLKVLRFDSTTRTWYLAGFSLNKVDMTVEVQSNKAGIFAVVKD